MHYRLEIMHAICRHSLADHTLSQSHGFAACKTTQYYLLSVVHLIAASKSCKLCLTVNVWKLGVIGSGNRMKHNRIVARAAAIRICKLIGCIYVMQIRCINE